MHRESAVTFEGHSRVHIGLEVADLERSIAFYRVLLGVEPSKLRPGYAKFEPAEPSLNLSLTEGRAERARHARGSGHFGVQVRSSGVVQSMLERFEAAGLATRLEEATACCYAVQDKVWVHDPDGNPWEVFVVVEADADQLAPTQDACCQPGGCGEP